MDFDANLSTLAAEIKNTQTSVDEASNLLLSDLVSQLNKAKQGGQIDALIASVQTSKRDLVNALAQVASRQYDPNSAPRANR